VIGTGQCREDDSDAHVEGQPPADSSAHPARHIRSHSLHLTRQTNMASGQELQMAGINFKAFDLGGHEVARLLWKDYFAKVCP